MMARDTDAPKDPGRADDPALGLKKDPELRRELDATAHTLKELGPEYEAELIDSFLEKVGERIDRRMDATADRQVRRYLAERQMSAARGVAGRQPGDGPALGGFGQRFGFAAVSLVLAVPLSAIAAYQAHLAGLVVTWVGIVGVNVAQSAWMPWRRRSAEQPSEGWGA
ncbi:hypothetical protein [Streptomyces hesseae]|uniref:Integral membrane protein n=1 Tax=Streptomyces hesseae TaxID=3075519 RepID=A0ABU2SI56_9ACTN|nr:hypothetical protein [Streptomyces sp. DSM 40473]MDT0448656.1 hypothetical protein [Streptomyces sp. DSM 40473]